ncbi:unnamed protein product [Paramecium sonneborni]|uniref:Uncharacterized protein n=1 Tax=Paramecium sonneborni TaxID=65129 RepID=A0A8S1NW19_9CILI|nr:unnamed protein product [Paramecium sonneborni]
MRSQLINENNQLIEQFKSSLIDPKRERKELKQKFKIFLMVEGMKEKQKMK